MKEVEDLVLEMNLISGSLPETATKTKVRAATTARAMLWILGRKPQSSSQTNLSVGATGFATVSN